MRKEPTTPASNTPADTAVQQLLRDAFQEAPAGSTGFRAAVRARIDARIRPLTWPQWLRGHLIGVTAATAACALAAIVLGGWVAIEQNRSQRQSYIANYVSSIDAHRQVASQSAPEASSGSVVR